MGKNSNRYSSWCKKLIFFPIKVEIPGTWKQIVKVTNYFLDFNIDIAGLFKRSMGKGDNISFWCDTWASDVPFLKKFHILYKLERVKLCCLVDRYMFSGDNMLWN